jgi:hypothetical protein
MTKRAEAALGMLRRLIGLVLPVVIFFSFGCGKPRGDISGKVTYQGQPVPDGTITFFDADNKQVGSSSLSEAGEYSLIKVPAGPVKITVTTALGPSNRRKSEDTPSAGPKKVQVPEGAQPDAPKWRGGAPARRRVVTVPAKYNSPDQSGLTYTVQPGKQEHNFDLE